MEYHVHIIDCVGMQDPPEPQPPRQADALRKHIEQMDREARRRMLESAQKQKDDDHA